ncbi:hypothetical protein, partial [Helicobacter japonicus]|uniref:hypothetical protein n=1 Tax=Helicobacter japonicus TaxID=425400 RepID=UPI00263A57C6
EPAAPTLARLCSTTELLPRKYCYAITFRRMILSMLDKKIKGKKQNIIKKLSFYYIIRAN